MTVHNVLIVGAGKLGSRLALQLASRFEVCVLSRTASEHEDLRESGVRCIDADVLDQAMVATTLTTPFDFIVYCVAPGERSESAYRALYVDGWRNVLGAIAESQSVQHVFFVSSTSVYHQDDCGWVDESSPTHPGSYSGQTILEAEKIPSYFGYVSTNIRFSGIYGGSRQMLRNQVREGRAFYCSETRLSNRIHEDDCVGFLVHLIGLAAKGKTLASLYLASDDCPVDLNDVYALIANQEGCELTKSDTAGKRRSGNKRCRNNRMKDTGYCLLYPSYREGYALP